MLTYKTTDAILESLFHDYNQLNRQYFYLLGQESSDIVLVANVKKNLLQKAKECEKRKTLADKEQAKAQYLQVKEEQIHAKSWCNNAQAEIRATVPNGQYHELLKCVGRILETESGFEFTISSDENLVVEKRKNRVIFAYSRTTDNSSRFSFKLSVRNTTFGVPKRFLESVSISESTFMFGGSYGPMGRPRGLQYYSGAQIIVDLFGALSRIFLKCF